MKYITKYTFKGLQNYSLIFIKLIAMNIVYFFIQWRTIEEVHQERRKRAICFLCSTVHWGTIHWFPYFKKKKPTNKSTSSHRPDDTCNLVEKWTAKKRSQIWFKFFYFIDLLCCASSSSSKRINWKEHSIVHLVWMQWKIWRKKFACLSIP